MKTAVLLSIAAFIVGLPFPYLGILVKIPLLLIVVVMDLAASSREDEGWRKHLVGYVFVSSLIVTYLFKFIFVNE